jgi:regulator of RNase E activity RraA
MFSRFEPYSIEVIETGGDTSSAHFGELNATACIARKVAGTVTDGGTRDTAQLFRLNYPVFCRYQNPVAATGRWKVVEYQTPIKLPGAVIAEVPIYPGDFIFGDVDGVVIVPKNLIQIILEACEQHLEIEKRAASELATGGDVTEIFNRYRKF